VRENARHNLQERVRRETGDEEDQTPLPTTSSSRKNAESITRRTMILLDFEIPIFLVATAVTGARGAQQALIESSEGQERWIEEQIPPGVLRTAF